MHADAQMLLRRGDIKHTAPQLRPARNRLDRFEPFGCTLVVRRAQTICEHGEAAEFCWRIQSGCVRTVEWLGGGRRRIGAFLREGDFLGIDIEMHAMGKTASFLLALDERSAPPDSNVVALPMSRTDIADHLGLSIETVCRNLVHLQRDGAVRLMRSGVELCNRVALLRLALE